MTSQRASLAFLAVVAATVLATWRHRNAERPRPTRDRVPATILSAVTPEPVVSALPVALATSEPAGDSPAVRTAPPVDAPPRTIEDARPVLYRAAMEGEWSVEAMEKLRASLIAPTCGSERRFALWASARCASSQVVAWLDELVRGASPMEDRVVALLTLARRGEAEVIGILERELHSSEAGLRAAARAGVERRRQAGGF